MRELKFRAWDGKKMIDDVIPVSETDIVELFEYEHQVTEVEVVEQYTGLKGKNGKDIYEGDIVRWTDDYDENGYIDFGDGCFRINWSINIERINGDMVDDLEVIGNIHENADLLEEEE